MTLLPDYLYSKILNEIILYLYKNKLRRFYFSIWSFDNTEIMQYCISKRFFSILSNLLLEHLSFDNYKYLKCFIKEDEDNNNNLDISLDDNSNSNNNNNNNNNNNKNHYHYNSNHNCSHNNSIYKLIKTNYKIKVYKSLKEYEYDNNSKMYYKVLVNINNEEDSSTVLENYNSYPENCKFNLFLNSQDLIDRDFPITTINNSSNNNNKSSNHDNSNNNEIFNKSKIKFIYIYFIDTEHTRNLNLWNKLSKLSPKECLAFSVGQSDFTNLLTIKSIKSLTIPNLDKLIDFSKLDNSSTSIRKLSISIFYHSIIKVCNPDIDFKCFFSNKISQLNCKELKDYWCSLVSALSNNKTIRELMLVNKCNITLDESRYSNGCSFIKNSLYSNNGGNNFKCTCSDKNGIDSCYNNDSNFDSNCNCIDSFNKDENYGQYDGYGIESKDLDLSFINKGFETILKSKILKLESLAIHNFNFIDSSFLSGLEKNKTIKNLILKYTNIQPFFKYVLNSNRVIRNLVIEYSDNEEIIEDQLQFLLNLINNNTVELYSVSVVINYSNDHQVCLDLIKKNQSSLSNLKEFNIYNNKLSSIIKFQLIKLNNKIGTIVTYQSKNI